MSLPSHLLKGPLPTALSANGATNSTSQDRATVDVAIYLTGLTGHVETALCDAANMWRLGIREVNSPHEDMNN